LPDGASSEKRRAREGHTLGRMTATYATVRASRALPLLGHAVPLLRDPLRFLASLPDQGDVVWIRVGPFKVVVVCDAELTRQVLLDDRTFDKGGLLVDRGREVVGNGVGTCPHGEHRRQRRLMQPAFHAGRLPGYAQVMTDQIAAVTDSWPDGQIIDVLDEMLTITVRTIAKTIVTASVPAPDALGKIIDDFAVTLAGIYKRMFLPPPLDRIPTPGNRRYDRARTRLRKTLGQVIIDYRASGVDHGDVLSMLITPDEKHQELSDTEITDQIITLFLAGTESTASVLAWALHVLGGRPDLEKRLHAEVDAVLSGAAPTFADVPALELTGHIVTEILRLYPPGWLFTRVATTDTHLGEHPIPAGTTVIYSPYLIHRSNSLYTDAERFDPDRWDSQHVTRIPRGAFVAFSAGARKCLGDNFAMTEATLALAYIASRWRLRPVPGREVRTTVDTTLRPRGLHMRVEAR